METRMLVNIGLAVLVVVGLVVAAISDRRLRGRKPLTRRAALLRSLPVPIILGAYVIAGSRAEPLAKAAIILVGFLVWLATILTHFSVRATRK